MIDETAAVAAGKLLLSAKAWSDLLGHPVEDLLKLGRQECMDGVSITDAHRPRSTEVHRGAPTVQSSNAAVRMDWRRKQSRWSCLRDGRDDGMKCEHAYDDDIALVRCDIRWNEVVATRSMGVYQAA